MSLSTTYTKAETDYKLQELQKLSVSGIKGTLKIADAAPTVQGLYILSDVGTYTNLGGIVTTTGKINYAYFDGTSWKLIAVDINLASLKKEIPTNDGFIYGTNTVNFNTSTGVLSATSLQTYITGNGVTFFVVDSAGNATFRISNFQAIPTNATLGQYYVIYSDVSIPKVETNAILQTAPVNTLPDVPTGKQRIVFGIGVKTTSFVYEFYSPLFKKFKEFDTKKSDIQKAIEFAENSANLLTITDFENAGKLAAKSKPFLLNPTRTNFDYRSLIDISLIGGNINDLKDSTGKWLELYLVFIRLKDVANSIPNYIVQIAKKNTSTGTVGSGNIMVSNFNTTDDSVLDTNGILTARTEASAGSNLYFKVLVDTTKLAAGDKNADLLGTLQLNTAYLARQLEKNFENSATDILCLGDSVTEFGDYPLWIEKITGKRTYNCGFGGTRYAVHGNVNYDKFSFYQLANAIDSGNWSAQDAANTALIAAGDDNTNQLNRLKAIDFNKIGIITLFYGTNDWSGNNPIGIISNTNFDTTTVVGAINHGIKKIIQKYPHIRILVVTPTHRFVASDLLESSDDVNNGISLKIESYVNAIEETANKFNHLPVKNLWKDGNFNKYNHSQYFVDGVHPNSKGYEVLGRLIGKEISQKF